tara:strand:+ start:519 stop:857 length:339 start_codon:yes stop_codon:yes gene_type:complete
LEEPGTGWNLFHVVPRGKSPGPVAGCVLIGDVAERPSAYLSAHGAHTGQVEFLQTYPRVTGKSPADLIGHPVAHPGENGLVKQESLEGGPSATGGQPTQAGERESRVQHFHG